MSTHICTNCGETTHRSKARNLLEKGVKSVSNYRAYSCPACGMRQWALKDGLHIPTVSLRTVAIFVAVLVATAAVALYVVDRTVKKEQETYIEQVSGN